MLLKCLACNYKYGDIAVLKYHYESCHKGETDNCLCGNIILLVVFVLIIFLHGVVL